MRIGAALSVPTFALAVTFGALARAEGWGLLAPVVASAVVFSGSAQFALVTVLGGGGGLLAALGSASLINARFLPMGVAVAQDLRGGRIRRAFEGQALVDGSFVAAHRGGGRYDRGRLLGATAAQWPAWVLGTLVGVLLAPPQDLVQALALDLIFPGFFLLLLTDELRRAPNARTVAALGGLTAAVLLLVAPPGVALVGASAVSLLGLRTTREKPV